MARKSSNLKNPDMIKVIAARFREAREDLGVTQDELAEKIGVPRTSLSKFEGGKRGLVGNAFAALLQAAAEKGMDLGYVFTGRKAAPQSALEDPDVLAGLKAIGAQHRHASTPTRRAGSR